jgi:8-oxo-dGTP pyrophosphatase MutT (NUDIX family)
MSESKILYETEYLQFKATQKPDGKGEWAYAHRANAKGIVVIVPLIDNERILFIKTRRPPLVAEGFEGFNIEFPAGLVADVDKNETTQECAKKELLEEAGLVAESFEVLTQRLSSSGGCVSEVSTIVLARVNGAAERFEPQDDGGIIVERDEVRVCDIPMWLKEQERAQNTIGAQTLAGLYYVLAREEQ